MFRPEALEENKTQWLGEIILARPMSFRLMTAGSAVTAAFIILFLIFGSYTQRTTVSGQLIPDSGLVKVYGTQRGLIQEKFVVEGQPVKRGDPLFILSSERHSRTQSNILETIGYQIRSRLDSLREERVKTEEYHRQEQKNLASDIASIETEIGKLKEVIAGQKRRVDIAIDHAHRYQSLATKGYVSQEQLQRSEEDLLDQRNNLRVRERELIGLERNLMSQRSDLLTLPSRQANQLAQIDRHIVSLEQELSETEARRELTVTAPETGLATAILAETGQAVESNQPLLSIVPSGARLQAVLYAPSAAVGFIKVQDTVQIRYQAFPYQKFGHGKGQVISVSKTAIAANELASLGGLMNNNPAGSEPLYRIVAQLDSETIFAFGRPEPLQAGMLLEADIMRETRRLYEWVLAPLYTVTGKL